MKLRAAREKQNRTPRCPFCFRMFSTLRGRHQHQRKANHMRKL